MSTALLVAVIVAGVLAFVATILLLVVRLVRRRRRRVDGRLAADLSSESALRGPEPARYRSGTGPYPKGEGNGKLVLTGTRLIFRIMIGTDVVVPLEEITAIRADNAFSHRRIVGQRFLVVTTSSGTMGFMVHQTEAWLAAVEQAVPHQLSAG